MAWLIVSKFLITLQLLAFSTQTKLSTIPGQNILWTTFNGSKIGCITGSDHYLVTDQPKKTVTSFLGIPYAKKQENRFSNSQERPRKESYHNFRKEVFCPNYFDRINLMDNEDSIYTENCLVLDIFVKSKFLRLNMGYTDVVILFLDPISDSKYLNSPQKHRFRAFLETTDSIVVRVNYRSGPLGFLYLDDEKYPGNYGLRDQQLAMKWVHENIKFFGGDNKRITVWGEQLGAVGLGWHLANEESLEYFNQAVLVNGAAFNPLTAMEPEIVKQSHLDFVTKIGCGKNAENPDALSNCLQSLPAHNFYNYNKEFSSIFLPFYQSAQLYSSSEGRSKKVKVMIGHQMVDSTSLEDYFHLPSEELVTMSIEERSLDNVMFEYKHHALNNETTLSTNTQFLSDYFLQAPSHRSAGMLTDLGNVVYFFDASESSYISPDSTHFPDQLDQYLINFIKNGVPKLKKGGVSWYAYSRANCSRLNATSSFQTVSTCPHIIQFWNDIIWPVTEHARMMKAEVKRLKNIPIVTTTERVIIDCSTEDPVTIPIPEKDTDDSYLPHEDDTNEHKEENTSSPPSVHYRPNTLSLEVQIRLYQIGFVTLTILTLVAIITIICCLLTRRTKSQPKHRYTTRSDEIALTEPVSPSQRNKRSIYKKESPLFVTVLKESPPASVRQSAESHLYSSVGNHRTSRNLEYQPVATNPQVLQQQRASGNITLPIFPVTNSNYSWVMSHPYNSSQQHRDSESAQTEHSEQNNPAVFLGTEYAL